ncbi:hypothetical protein ACLB1N_22380 [Escherichia coli]
MFIHGGPRVFTYYTPKESIKLFTTISICTVASYLMAMPVSVMFGCAPRQKGEVLAAAYA